MKAQDIQTCLDAQGSAATGLNIFVEDADKIVLQVATANSANMTFKFQGSVSNGSPDFSAAQSVSNHWDYVEVIDMEDGTAIDGDTGVALSGTDDVRLFSLNVDGLAWFNCTITTYVAGNLTVKAKPFINA